MKMDLDRLGQHVAAARQASGHFPNEAEQVFTAVLTALLLQGPPSHSTHDTADNTDTMKPKPLTASEFFSRLRPTQDVDKVLSAAYFVDVYRNKAEFSAEELRQTLLEAKISPPKNVSLGVLRNAQRGLIAQKEKQGKKITWLITQTGLEKVQTMTGERSAGSVSK
jgi:hypothetical protein